MNIKDLVLERGAHKDSSGGACVMEAVSYVAGEPWSDHPECACPVISGFLRAWNDDLNDEDRQMLKPLIPRLVNTNSTPEVAQQRATLISDWYLKVNVPAWLDTGGAPKLAGEAREKGSGADWSFIRDAAVSTVAAAAWSAAMFASRGAAWAAVGAAIGSAAGPAARHVSAAGRVTMSAAGVSAWAAGTAVVLESVKDTTTWASAWAAAQKKLRPTVVKLQQSAIELINSCIDIK